MLLLIEVDLIFKKQNCKKYTLLISYIRNLKIVDALLIKIIAFYI